MGQGDGGDLELGGPGREQRSKERSGAEKWRGDHDMKEVAVLPAKCKIFVSEQDLHYIACCIMESCPGRVTSNALTTGTDADSSFLLADWQL